MVAYMKDTDRLVAYDGASWQSIYIGDTGWITLSLTGGGWTEAETVQYRKIGQVIYLKGEIYGGTVGTTVVATLPEGYRPPNRIAFIATDYGSGTSDGRVSILVNGSILIFGANGGTTSPGITLGSISYVVA
jgi:hypothetical protein